MILIMISDTCTALRQAAPPDSLFRGILPPDSTAVADLESEASGSIFDLPFPEVLVCLLLTMFIFLFLSQLFLAIRSQSSQMELTRLRMVMMDIQKNLNSCCGRLEETIRETGRTAKTNASPRRSPSPSKRRKVAQTDSRSGEPFTQTDRETILKSHEEIQNTTL